MAAARKVVVALVALFGFSCGGPSQLDMAGGPDELAQVGQKQSAPEVYGTFVGDAKSAGELVRMVLMTDGRFHAEQSVVCISAPCDPMVLEGNFEFRVMNGVDCVKLTDETGAYYDDLEYAYAKSVLNIRPTSGAPRQEMKRGPAWCAEANDCKLQQLYTLAAEGAWHCESNLCRFHVKSEAAE
jgi:hypothetical protein